MKLLPIAQVFRALLNQGHYISRDDLYALAQEKKIPMVLGKTSVEAVLGYLARELQIPLPVLPVNPPHRNGCNARESKPKRDRQLSGPSSGQRQHVATSKSN